jgi:hypothetical protein
VARLRQVVGNILQNAIKFTPRGGQVVVRRADARAGRVAVEIADTGSGIDPGDISRIFRPSNRPSRGKAGLGLGLSISRSLIEAHGGTLSARSGGTGDGAIFRIELPGPVDPPSPAQRRTSRLARAGRRAPRAPRRGPRGHRLAARELLSDISVRGRRRDSLSEALEARECTRSTSSSPISACPTASGLDLMRDLRDRYGLRGIALTGFGMEEGHPPQPGRGIRRPPRQADHLRPPRDRDRASLRGGTRGRGDEADALSPPAHTAAGGE